MCICQSDLPWRDCNSAYAYHAMHAHWQPDTTTSNKFSAEYRASVQYLLNSMNSMWTVTQRPAWVRVPVGSRTRILLGDNPNSTGLQFGWNGWVIMYCVGPTVAVGHSRVGRLNSAGPLRVLRLRARLLRCWKCYSGAEELTKTIHSGWCGFFCTAI